MGYLADGKLSAFFIRLSDEDEKEMLRLYEIGKRTRKRRTRKKLAKRVDELVPVHKEL